MSRTRAWTPEEDKQLTSIMMPIKSGATKFLGWKHIKMPGRFWRSVQTRWNFHLDPDLNRSEFTAEEDQKILSLYTKMGNMWTEMARILGTQRSPNSIKARLNRIQKDRTGEIAQRIRQAEWIPSQPPPPPPPSPERPIVLSPESVKALAEIDLFGRCPLLEPEYDNVCKDPVVTRFLRTGFCF